jgi:adenylyltransferase/sulfurtransferase
VLAGIPLVHGSIFRFEGQLTVFNYQGGPTYRCLYPDPPNKLEAPPADQSGILAVLPGLIGCYMANEAIKVLLNIGKVLSGTLLVINMLENRFHHIQIPVREENRNRKEIAMPD